jgi:hypothetical protein
MNARQVFDRIEDVLFTDASGSKGRRRRGTVTSLGALVLGGTVFLFGHVGTYVATEMWGEYKAVRAKAVSDAEAWRAGVDEHLSQTPALVGELRALQVEVKNNRVVADERRQEDRAQLHRLEKKVDELLLRGGVDPARVNASLAVEQLFGVAKTNGGAQ